MLLQAGSVCVLLAVIAACLLAFPAVRGRIWLAGILE
jgi:hypothetical protein